MTTPRHQQGFHKVWIPFKDHLAYLGKLNWREQAWYQNLLWRAALGQDIPADPHDLRMFLGGAPMPEVEQIVTLLALIRDELQPHPSDPSLIQFRYIEGQRAHALAVSQARAASRKNGHLRQREQGYITTPKARIVPLRESHATCSDNHVYSPPGDRILPSGVETISSRLEGVDSPPPTTNSSPILAPIAPKGFGDE